MSAFFLNKSAFSKKVRVFFKHSTLFKKNAGLFKKNADLFKKNVGLFKKNADMFKKTRTFQMSAFWYGVFVNMQQFLLILVVFISVILSSTKNSISNLDSYWERKMIHIWSLLNQEMNMNLTIFQLTVVDHVRSCQQMSWKRFIHFQGKRIQEQCRLKMHYSLGWSE